MTSLYESDIEQSLIEHLQKLGYSYVAGPTLSPDGEQPERANYGEVILWGRLEAAIRRLNEKIPESAVTQVLRQIRTVEGADLIEKNRTMHKYLTQGVEVEAMVEGKEKGLRVQ